MKTVSVSAFDDVRAVLSRSPDGTCFRFRAGGHCSAGWSSNADVVLDVSALNGVAVERDHVRIGAGARLGEVVAALAARHVALPTGCGPTVGIAGLTLGGGLGVLGRMHGLTCDRLTSVSGVGADGSRIRASRSEHPELFWALQGAGAAGLIGVLELEYAVVRAPDAATNFRLEWPIEQAHAVWAAWQSNLPGAKPELAPSLHVLVPADVRRAPTVEISGSYLGPEEEARRSLAALCPVAASNTRITELPWSEVKADLAALPAPHEPRAHVRRRSGFHEVPLSDDAIASLVGNVVEDRRPGQSRELDVAPLGQAYGHRAVSDTAFAWRDAQFLLSHVVGTPGAGASPGASVPLGPVTPQAASWCDRSRSLAGPRVAAYANFPEAHHADVAAAHFGPNAERLRAAKQAWDPAGTFGDPFELLVDRASSRQRAVCD